MKILAQIIFLVGFFLLSCEKNANITLPEYNPKLVIHSFICPDDTVIMVNVSATLGIFGHDTIFLENRELYPEFLPAKVTLIDNDKKISFSLRDKKGFCYAKYKIEAGKEYKLLVQCEGYPDASAVCKVPLLNDLSIKLDTITKAISSPYGTFYDRKLLVNLTDIADQKNYYCLYGVDRGSDYKYQMFMEVSGEDFGSKMISYLSDNLVNGKTISTAFKYNKPDTLEAFILETDEHYYKYHISFEKYEDSDKIFTEFSPVYSNFKNGYGIFASYVRHKRLLLIE